MRGPHFIPMTTPCTPANAEHLHLSESIRRPAIEASAISSSSAHAETPGATNKLHLHLHLPPSESFHHVAIAAVGLESAAVGRDPDPARRPSGAAVRGKRARPLLHARDSGPPRLTQHDEQLQPRLFSRGGETLPSRLLGGRVRACGWEAEGERGSVNSVGFSALSQHREKDSRLLPDS